MSRIPKGFIPLNSKGDYINLKMIKEAYYNESNQLIAIDKYNVEHRIDKKYEGVLIK